jgi:asparagine synthase (glutamine-hydrolysing)
MAMAHGVEGRFPFLDHRLAEFAAALPSSSKLRGLREKEILRRWATTLLPARIADRPKRPYRAPDAAPFFGERRPSYVAELLSPERVREVGIFDPRAVAGLVRRCELGRVTGMGESQALVAILSTQLWHQAFCERAHDQRPTHTIDLQTDVIETEAELVGV